MDYEVGLNNNAQMLVSLKKELLSGNVNNFDFIWRIISLFFLHLVGTFWPMATLI